MQQRNDKTVDFHTHPVTDTFRREMEYLGIDPLEEDGFPHSPAKVVIEKKIHFEGNEKYNGLSERICRQNAQMLLRKN